MAISDLFINRPVATTLLTLGVALAGLVAVRLLPVSPLPQVEFPTISVNAQLPGASPETMAATVATPLERSLGRIAGVSEMTSSSSLGSSRITLQFDLDRDIDGAARDVQAAINAARTLLPSGMPGNPTYKKVNPADAPFMIIALTSETMSKGQMYDVASTILAQKIAQLEGIGQVNVGGSSLPAVRAEMNPLALDSYGIGFEDVRTAIVGTNANRPKGVVEEGDRSWQIYANDQAMTAKEYMPLIVAYRNGAPVRISDVGEVVDSVQDLRNAGAANGKQSVLLLMYRQAGANIVETADRVRALMPTLRASIPAAIDMNVVMERTTTIRTSMKEMEHSLAIAIGLVIGVVFLFLRNVRAMLVPSVAVPISLLGTFSVMYLCGYSLDNLSLMALTVATGFVVDDAIVVVENISRHIEDGMEVRAAAHRGAREVVFTVVSMSLSLIAVFLPILAMGGIIGRLFREFAVTLSAAILVSLVVSVTTTPMMCARLLRAPDRTHAPSAMARAAGRVVTRVMAVYERSLAWALDHGPLMMLLLAATVALNVYLYVIVPKGFFPQQDTGRLFGNIQADQGISFQAMRGKFDDFMRIVQKDPAVDSVVGFTGGGQRNSAVLFIGLKPMAERRATVDQVIGRLRGKLSHEAGANLFLAPVQDLRMGGRPGNAQYQYTLEADDLEELRQWEPKIRLALSHLPQLVDVNTDQQDKGLQTDLVVDRDAVARLGLTMRQVDAALNDAFGQRQVSTLYAALNQYHVVLEAAPQYWQSPESLNDIYIGAPGGKQVPLSTVAHYVAGTTPLAVSHQGQFTASTITFNLPVGVSLSQATRAIEDAMARIQVPASIRGGFQGQAKAFQASVQNQPILILAALVAVYIVLGVLYESYVHPITILSTLPSAGVGALLALMVAGMDFTLISLIGVLLLIGIVKKNAIMMIDFALDAERSLGLTPREAILRAGITRFRPIMMTTLAALFGAIPLSLGVAEGSELRAPLGISIVGGLLVSQLLTLYTTPVVYLYLDRFRLWVNRHRRRVAGVGEVVHE